jgi:hypothetical protein
MHQVLHDWPALRYKNRFAVAGSRQMQVLLIGRSKLLGTFLAVRALLKRHSASDIGRSERTTRTSFLSLIVSNIRASCSVLFRISSSCLPSSTRQEL